MNQAYVTISRPMIVGFSPYHGCLPQIHDYTRPAKPGSGAIPSIEPVLNDSDTQVRHEAAEEICRDRGRPLLNPLIRATGDNVRKSSSPRVDGLVNFYHCRGTSKRESRAQSRAGPARPP